MRLSSYLSWHIFCCCKVITHEEISCDYSVIFYGLEAFLGGGGVKVQNTGGLMAVCQQ